MIGTFIALLLFAAAALLWSNASAAHERARLLAHQACQRSGVQLLDQTVSLDRMGLGRSADGRLRISRRYRFDYSRQGDDRYRGALALLGTELLWLQQPPQRDEL